MLDLPGGPAVEPARRPPRLMSGERPVAAADAKREQLLEVLRETSWNISPAAAALGITRNTVRPGWRRTGSLRRTPGRVAPDSTRTASRADDPAGRRAAAGDAAPRCRPRRCAGSAGESRSSRPRWSRRPGGVARRHDRVLEALIDKVGIFGGRVEELGLGRRGLRARGGRGRAAPRGARRDGHAAGTRARPARGRRAPSARVGIHVGSVLVVAPGGTAEIERDGQARGVDRARCAGRRGEPGIVASAAAATSSSVASLSRALSEPPARLSPARPGAHGPAARGRLASFVGRRQELDLLQSRLAPRRTGTGRSSASPARPASASRGSSSSSVNGSAAGTSPSSRRTACPTAAISPICRSSSSCAAGAASTRPTPPSVADKVRRALSGRPRPRRGHAVPASIPGGEEPRAQLDKLEPGSRPGADHRYLPSDRSSRPSRRRPLIVVVEDLHWMDAASDGARLRSSRGSTAYRSSSSSRTAPATGCRGWTART